MPPRPGAWSWWPDDDVEVRLVLARWLTKAGYDVELYPDGAACLDGLSRSMPDAICLDLEMPRLDGLETLARIRANHRLLPVNDGGECERGHGLRHERGARSHDF